MQPLRVVIDVRHIKDFGIGTYIRNLVKALSEIDTYNRYLLAANNKDVPDIPALPPNFETVVYHEPRNLVGIMWLFPGFSRDCAGPRPFTCQ